MYSSRVGYRSSSIRSLAPRAAEDALEHVAQELARARDARDRVGRRAGGDEQHGRWLW